MAISIAFRFLKIVCEREARNGRELHRQENIRMKHRLRLSSSKIKQSDLIDNQSSSTIRFIIL